MPLVSRPFGDIITFTRASTGTFIDASGVLQTAAVNAPRLDFDPVTLAARGFLIENQRTNTLRNAQAGGAVVGVVGSGGSLPTNWGTFSIDTVQVLGVGTEAGRSFVDVRLAHTNSSGGNQFPLLYLDGTSGGTNAATGQTWTHSAWVQVLSGTSPAGVRLQLRGSVSGDAPSEVPTLAILPGGVRTALTHTFAVVGITRAHALIDFGSLPTGQTLDVTLRIAAPQLEQGPFATSYIPTTGAQATRAGDLASVNTLSPWYNLSEGTMLVEFVRAGFNEASTADTGFAVLFESSSSLVSLQASFSVQPNQVFLILNGGVQQTGIVQHGNTTNTLYRMGAGWAANNVAFAQNGVLVGTDTTATIPTVTQLLLGRLSLTGHQLNGWLRRFQYFPRRLSNAEIQALTAI